VLNFFANNYLASLRTQMSAAHSTADIDRAVAAFSEVGRELAIVS
jgi:glycine C-acetyltransferase